VAKRYGVYFYKRPERLATSETKSDLVIYDFMKNNPCHILVWVNPISPLQTAHEIKNAVHYFLNKNLDSLITTRFEKVHCLYQGKPINFKKKEAFSKTQDLIPVQKCVYSLMMWRSTTFIQTFEKKGYGLFCGKVGFYPVSLASSLIVKTKEDLALLNQIVKSTNQNG